MEKLVYLVWKREADGIEPFRERLLERAAPKLLAEGALSLVANVADLHAQIPPRHPLVVGDGREISACVSVWLESQDARPALESTLAGVASKVHGYLVTESVPLRCPDRTWPDGGLSPGVTLWTAFPKPERLADDTFFAHWYGSHTPLSFQTLEEILDFTRFFGGDLANVKRVTDDLAAFTEMATMNTTPMSEFIVRSEPWL